MVKVLLPREGSESRLFELVIKMYACCLKYVIYGEVVNSVSMCQYVGLVCGSHAAYLEGYYEQCLEINTQFYNSTEILTNFIASM